MLQKMMKIQVIGPQEDLHNVMDLLYRKGTVQIEDATAEGTVGGVMLRRMSVDEADSISAAWERSELFSSPFRRSPGKEGGRRRI